MNQGIAIGKIQAVEELVHRLSNMPERRAGEGSKNIDEVALALGIEKSIAVVLRYGNEIADKELQALKGAMQE